MAKRHCKDVPETQSVRFERVEPARLPIPLEKQPVGTPMQGRSGLEFMGAMANLDPATLRGTGEPGARNDLSHVDGVCYELCRFAQAQNSFYQRLRAAAYRDPAGTLGPLLAPLKAMVEAVADSQDLKIALQPGPEIIVYGRQIQEARRRQLGLPFYFVSKHFDQALVVTGVFYLGLTRDSRLLRRCAERDCGRIFVAVRETRMYCSSTCAGRASTRASRQRGNVTARRVKETLTRR